MPDCGTQVILCDLPVRFDTYKGCSHGCKYCFASKFNDMEKICREETSVSLQKWIDGERTKKLSWCDWDIPLHIGGMSDPLQPYEKECRETYKCLKVLEKSGYPFVISTKGALLGEKEYLDILQNCNCVIQISAVCDSYDSLEKGAPTFRQRLEIGRSVSKTGKRLIYRIQPYLHECYDEIYSVMQDMADSGAYGVIIEGMKYNKKVNGYVKVAGDWCIDYKTIKADFLKLKERANSLGMKCYAGENRIRELGDSLTCCGIDGLEGFKPNTFNCNHIVRGERVKPNPKMVEPMSGAVFQSLGQDTKWSEVVKKNTFASLMVYFLKHKRKMVSEIFGISR